MDRLVDPKGLYDVYKIQRLTHREMNVEKTEWRSSGE